MAAEHTDLGREWREKRFTQLDCPHCGPNAMCRGANDVFMCTGCGSLLMLDGPKPIEVWVSLKPYRMEARRLDRELHKLGSERKRLLEEIFEENDPYRRSRLAADLFNVAADWQSTRCKLAGCLRNPDGSYKPYSLGESWT